MMGKRFVVLNRIRKVDIVSAPVKRWAVIRLLNEFPEAHHIRFEGKCHCKSKYLMSFITDEMGTYDSDTEEYCGYFCATCKFSNAGSRERYKQHTH